MILHEAPMPAVFSAGRVAATAAAVVEDAHTFSALIEANLHKAVAAAGGTVAGDASQAFGALTNALTTAIEQFRQTYPDRNVSAR